MICITPTLETALAFKSRGIILCSKIVIGFQIKSLNIGPWVYIQTDLVGKYVLTAINSKCDDMDMDMEAKRSILLPSWNQLWRHEDNGLLRNKAQWTKCLGIVSPSSGSTFSFHFLFD